MNYDILLCHLKINVLQNKSHYYVHIFKRKNVLCFGSFSLLGWGYLVGYFVAGGVFLIAILRLSVLLGGRSKLWLNPADDSLADLRIFQILKYMSGFLKTPQNFKNTRLVSPFPR